MDELALVCGNFFFLSGICKVDLGSEMISYTLELATLFVFLAQHVDEFISVNVGIDLKLLDFVFEFLESLGFRVLVLVESLSVSFYLLHFLLKLFDDFLRCRERLLGKEQLLLEDSFPLFTLSHLVPQVCIVRQLFLHQVDFVLKLLLHEHFLSSPEQSLLAHHEAGLSQLSSGLLLGVHLKLGVLNRVVGVSL